MVLHNCSIVVIFAFENEGYYCHLQGKVPFYILLFHYAPKHIQNYATFFFICLKYSWELLFLEKIQTHSTSFNVISVFKAADNETV